eukprot:Opistho-2@22722
MLQVKREETTEKEASRSRQAQRSSKRAREHEEEEEDSEASDGGRAKRKQSKDKGKEKASDAKKQKTETELAAAERTKQEDKERRAKEKEYIDLVRKILKAKEDVMWACHVDHQSQEEALDALARMEAFPVTKELMEETKVGKIVHKLAHYKDDVVRNRARDVLGKWYDVLVKPEAK